VWRNQFILQRLSRVWKLNRPSTMLVQWRSWLGLVKMLQNCPKLQTLKIDKVCLSNQWIVIDFYLFFSYVQVFLQIIFCFLLTVDRFIENHKGLETPISCSWMCYLYSNNMWNRRLSSYRSRLSICNIYFAKCKDFTGYGNP